MDRKNGLTYADSGVDIDAGNRLKSRVSSIGLAARDRHQGTGGGDAMDMREEWLRGLRAWASSNDNVRELWLFGSRANGSSRPASDVDIAVALMPAVGDHDWALGNFAALRHKEWQPQLEAIVGRHVSLEAVLPDTPRRGCWVLLWARD
jgi:predicted nucleotidyltransferase